MRYSLLSILKNNHDYVSGEYLSSTLGVSRTSVWKHINALKKEGYNIDGKSNKGYKLINSSIALNKYSILENLNTSFIGKEIFHFKNLDSTNVTAKEIAKKGAIDGTLVISDEQCNGKGRFERIWSSPKGGLWFSLILLPFISPIDASKITLIAAQSIFKVLRSFGVNAEIKWPNDILINQKKICGILTEMNCDMDKVNYIVLGIGLNSNFDISVIASELQNTCTTLINESTTTIDNIQLLCKILEEFEKDYSYYVDTLDIKVALNVIKNNCNILNKQIYVKTIREEYKAKCIDIDINGNLVLQKEDGNIITQTSGEISSKPFTT